MAIKTYRSYALNLFRWTPQLEIFYLHLTKMGHCFPHFEGVRG